MVVLRRKWLKKGSFGRLAASQLKEMEDSPGLFISLDDAKNRDGSEYALARGVRKRRRHDLKDSATLQNGDKDNP